MADDVPPFSLDAPRYDQSTYVGRWRQFKELTSPLALLVSTEQIEDARETLAKYRRGDITRDDVSDAKLWDARRVYESAVHPQTGEIIPAIFRLSAFVPANIPISAGMLLTAPTLGNTIFWQWVNQSFNAGFNYANRNASAEQDTSAILKSYTMATVVSCASAVGLGRALDKAKSLSPGTRAFLGKMVPFTAVASAGAFNAVAMRYNELVTGIDVVDEDGTVLGRSKAAASQCLTQVALTRVAIPVPILLLPPYLFEGLRAMKMMPKAKGPRIATELAVLTMCLWGAFPAAVALFPEKGHMDVKKLEEEFWSSLKKDGKPVEQVTYHKGI